MIKPLGFATIPAALRVGNSMPTCFSKRKVRWTVARPMWLARAIRTRLMREFFCLLQKNFVHLNK
ncbi:hypothetical protein EGK75_00095 [Neisseria weixii]|uniref:Uncharacterized protein n=1 Tax=Neisseria weixii TaxID=1853276 RepID=A0A3N4N613_9NEIS|nr:hypothetical protein CGZ65_11490 [Neisseria weixii]RPD90795.1 hypothetical protein EGK74_00095 [Neisseria weixii]RPD90988.1 hypothetical protein EGK75_00095 [Neisseria weixii]